MADLSTTILDAAYADGIFDGPLNTNQINYLPPSILTAWQLLDLVQKAKGQGIDIDQLVNRSRLGQNTVLIYCRWLRSKGLITADRTGGPMQLIYFSA